MTTATDGFEACISDPFQLTDRQPTRNAAKVARFGTCTVAVRGTPVCCTPIAANQRPEVPVLAAARGPPEPMLPWE